MKCSICFRHFNQLVVFLLPKGQRKQLNIYNALKLGIKSKGVIKNVLASLSLSSVIQAPLRLSNYRSMGWRTPLR